MNVVFLFDVIFSIIYDYIYFNCKISGEACDSNIFYYMYHKKVDLKFFVIIFLWFCKHEDQN